MDPLAPTPLRLLTDIGELPKLTAYIELFSETNDISTSDTMAFTLAAEELFANTVHHSKIPVTLIEFQLEFDGHTLLATYTDNASPFDPTQRDTPDTSLSVEDREIGGLGIHLIQRTMELFRYERTGDCNVITFGRQRHRA